MSAMHQPTAEQALARLSVLVGEWRVTMTGPDGAPAPGEGHTRIAWHPSGAHLVIESRIEVPGAPDSVSIVGCDAGQGTYTQLYSDERGVCRTYAMSIDAHEWKLWRDGDPFAQRFVAALGGDVMEGRWEKAVDGENFELDFHLTYTRVTGGD